jgi:arsenate reductase
VNRQSRFQNFLFVGQGNDIQTQMAEAFAKLLLAPLSVGVRSAGVRPTRLHPMAIEVMAEVGIDISTQRSKPLDAIEPSTIDKIVLVEPGLAIPESFSAARCVQWQLNVPYIGSMSSAIVRRNFRQARDDVEMAVLKLIARALNYTT